MKHQFKSFPVVTQVAAWQASRVPGDFRHFFVMRDSHFRLNRSEIPLVAEQQRPLREFRGVMVRAGAVARTTMKQQLALQPAGFRGDDSRVDDAKGGARPADYP